MPYFCFKWFVFIRMLRFFIGLFKRHAPDSRFILGRVTKTQRQRLTFWKTCMLFCFKNMETSALRTMSQVFAVQTVLFLCISARKSYKDKLCNNKIYVLLNCNRNGFIRTGFIFLGSLPIKKTWICMLVWLRSCFCFILVVFFRHFSQERVKNIVPT